VRSAQRHPDDFADAFSAAFARLQVLIERACLDEGPFDWPAQVAAAVREALAFAAGDPAAANVLTNEALAMGRAGFARYDRMLEHFARDLRRGRAERPEGAQLPEITEKAMVGGIAMLIAQRLDRSRAIEMLDLLPEAIQFVLTPYVGIEEARRMGRRRLD
jgi:hypothetical protein